MYSVTTANVKTYFRKPLRGLVNYFVPLSRQACPILTTCSSREFKNSSGATRASRTSREIGVTICTIGSSGECDTFR